MDKLFFLEAKCAKNKKDFYIRYDLAADDNWCQTYGLKELPPKTEGGGYSVGGGQHDISDARIGPQYKCPWCGDTSFVRCGKCQNLTCYDSSGTFTCAHCGRSGKVSGYIESIKVTHSGGGQ